MPRGDTLEEVWRDSFAEVEAKYGEKWLFFHRQDLHAGLRQMAESDDLDGSPAKIRLSSEVTELDADSGTFKLADGTTVRKDLVVVSNGVHVGTMCILALLSCLLETSVASLKA